MLIYMLSSVTAAVHVLPALTAVVALGMQCNDGRACEADQPPFSEGCMLYRNADAACNRLRAVPVMADPTLCGT
jgi:hypothetical protein